MQLQPKTYQYKHMGDNAPLSYGFIAQDVEKIYPEFVMTDSEGMKSIAYSNFGVVAISAVQEQQQIIEQQQLDEQQQQIEQLLERLEKLESN